MTTATDVLAKARLDIGYNGTGTEDNPLSKFGAWYGINPGQWCAMAVSYWFSEAGMPKIHYAYCPTGVNAFKSGAWGTWHGKNEYLQPGDVIFWDYGMGRASHTGICEIGGGSGDLITSIQGNTTDASIGRTGNVCRRKQHYRAYMVGFGRPRFSTGTETASDNTPSVGSQLGGAAGAADYTVKAGDTLASIAADHLIDDWHTIYNLNKNTIGADPNQLEIGMKLTLRAVAPEQPDQPAQPSEEEDDDMKFVLMGNYQGAVWLVDSLLKSKVGFRSGADLKVVQGYLSAHKIPIYYVHFTDGQWAGIPSAKG